MTDPRPAYGEYASPEEQARRMGVEPTAAGPHADAAPARPRRNTAARRDAAPQPDASAADRAGARRPFLPALSGPRRVDRIVGLVFVLWGLISVVQTIPQLTNLPSYLYDSFELLGIDAELADPSGARGWGVAGAFVFGLTWLLTAAWSWRRARAGKIFFWVPIVGAVVATVVVAILISVPLMNDPALLQSIVDQMPQP